MIVLHHSDLSEAELHELTSRLEKYGASFGYKIQGRGAGWGNCVELQIAVPELANEAALVSQLKQCKEVTAVLTDQNPTHYVAPRESETQISLGNWAKFGGGAVSVIAGPCSIENPDDLIAVAEAVKIAGATVLRGGAFKPRTSPYSFQGLGRDGLEMMAATRKITGLPILTEVMDTRDVEQLVEYADALQIGSRNMMNYSLLKEAGSAGLPVMLKRGMSATLHEFLLAAEYLAHAGCQDILLCERGLRHFDPALRNLLDLSAVPALKQRTHLPVIVDPSHGTGDSTLVPPMMAAAAAAGADGIMVEVHPRPSRSVSDAGQALSPQEFSEAMHATCNVLEAVGRPLHKPQQATITL